MGEFNWGTDAAQNTRFNWKIAKRLAKWTDPGSYTLNDTTLQLGKDAKSWNATNAVVLGNGASGGGDYTITIGNNASNSAGNSIAIGYGADTHGTRDNVTIGYNATGAANAVVIGSGAKAASQTGIAIGKNASSSSLKSVAIGYEVKTTGPQVVAIGGNIADTALKGIMTGTVGVFPLKSNTSGVAIPTGCQGIVISSAGAISIAAAGSTVATQNGGIVFVVKIS